MKRRRLALEFAVLALGLISLGCKKSNLRAEKPSAIPAAVEFSAPSVWPATGARLLVYDVENINTAKRGGMRRIERAKTVTVDPAKPNVAVVATTDEYQPVMTEYFLVSGDEVSWTAYKPGGVMAQKTEIEPPLLLFKKSFQGGEVAGANSPLEITVIGWEDLEVMQEEVRVCKIRISFVAEKSEKFTGFHRTLWFHDQWGPVKEEKILYKDGEIIEKESAVLRSRE